MNLMESYRELQEARSATILGLAKLAEYRDEGTGSHLERIREYAKRLAEEMAKLPKYSHYITQGYIDDIFFSKYNYTIRIKDFKGIRIMSTPNSLFIFLITFVSVSFVRSKS